MPDSPAATDATQAAAIIAESGSSDTYVRRARPTFLYIMYAMILMALPMGLLSAALPTAASAINAGIRAYLAAIPDALYAMFGTGYLGYTAARQWGKIAGSDR